MMERNVYLDVASEVREALRAGKPVVALESTIISHGMPYPVNVETALAVEANVRKQGGVPATIAVIGGRIKVGLTRDEIEHLARAKGVRKVSRRDLPVVTALEVDGATTVAGTMIVAQMAGISVFVTGGVGGVHRGAGESFDISADLEELKQTDVTVVCAGCKSLLDIPATLEYLETGGVPVIVFGSDEFPAFYSASSGCASPLRMDTPEEIASVIAGKKKLGMKGGLLVTCPIPAEDEIPFDEIDRIIRRALALSAEEGITGSGITPYVLQKIVDLTEGRALRANQSLVLNNGLIGTDIATALCRRA
ncbi:MAG TPA: pseudouridine-5'-phosphate glycosidase [Bacillota bacterium]|nr:pseudouridine-5'-phosphate glycosidase [Bacillota bacterium]